MTTPKNNKLHKEANTGSEAWIHSLDKVLKHGELSTPRGMATLELMNQQITFDMNYPICAHNQRKLSYKFMAAEAYWITSGSPLVEDIAPYNSHIAEYSDDEYLFNGAYGPAFLAQVNYVVDCLYKDNNTRQAVMTIWHPNPIKSKDQKCTVALVFSIRHHTLNVSVLMRSNDLILGRPYDMFNFTIMTLRVLTLLNAKKGYEDDPINLGNQTLTAVSSHVYDCKLEMAYNITSGIPDRPTTSKVPSRCLTDWNYVVKSLLACRDNIEDDTLWEIRP